MENLYLISNFKKALVDSFSSKKYKICSTNILLYKFLIIIDQTFFWTRQGLFKNNIPISMTMTHTSVSYNHGYKQNEDKNKHQMKERKKEVNIRIKLPKCFNKLSPDRKTALAFVHFPNRFNEPRLTWFRSHEN